MLLCVIEYKMKNVVYTLEQVTHKMTQNFRKVRVQLSRVKHINVHKTSRLVYIGNKLSYAYN